MFYFSKIISDLCRYLEYFSYLFHIAKIQNPMTTVVISGAI